MSKKLSQADIVWAQIILWTLVCVFIFFASDCGSGTETREPEIDIPDAYTEQRKIEKEAERMRDLDEYYRREAKKQNPTY